MMLTWRLHPRFSATSNGAACAASRQPLHWNHRLQSGRVIAAVACAHLNSQSLCAQSNGWV